MEMNTRIQVEHTITEVVAGVDIVRAQIQIALGERLEFTQDEIRLQGHAIECRINAEDPSAGFLPSPGTITRYREPSGPGCSRRLRRRRRARSISPLYDPMIAKLIVRGADREDAIGRMLRALGEYQIGGVKTLIGFHKALLSHPCFRAGETCYGVVESPELAARAEELSGRASCGRRGHRRRADRRARRRGRRSTGAASRSRCTCRSRATASSAAAGGSARRGGAGAGSGTIVSPMQGTVLDVKVAEGDTVEAGQVICVIEAMKMENEVTAVVAGTVTELAVAPLQPISVGDPIVTIEPTAVDDS